MCTDVLKDNTWNILVLLQECVWDPYFGYKEKVETLKRKMNELICRKQDIMDEIENAEHHSSKPRKTVVINWLSKVERLVQEFESFEQKVQQTCRYSPSRICLSRHADKIQREMEDLQEQSAFPEGYFLDVNEKQLPLVTTNLKGQLFEKNLREVLVSLNEVSSIGIYGMGGVGKTTLATHIHDHLLNDPRFSGNAYWITVSQDFSITKLQDSIAKILKLDLSTEDDERKRTAKLSQNLKRKKSFVLILDDVWSSFKVEEVGIPLETGKGKLIITSRSVEVCEGIGCQKKVKVGTLSSTESWELFVEILNHNGDLPKEIEQIAKKMANKCDGLPLGLITIAASMRGVTDVSEWRYAFREFEESCMQVEYMNDKVFPILRYSYNRLRDQRLQKCFVYCCLYPEDYKIERDELIGLFIVEGFLDSMKSRLAEFDQGHVVLNKLERACLLESVVNSDKERCVRMHDLVREMALQIGRDEFKWMVKAGAQLREIQRFSDDLDKVSLMDNDIWKISVPLSYGRPMLTTLLLQRNRDLSQIVDHLFVQMPGLRVLNLSDTAIKKLPSSVSNLENLSTLLLRNCEYLKFVPPLNKLKKLIELDLYNTYIEEVPQGLESLVNLRCLDMGKNLRETEPPFKKPAVDILARLSNLQSLSIPFVVRVEDLLGMRHLEVFHGVFIDVCSFNSFVRQIRGKPSAFKIVLDPKESSNLYSYGTGSKLVSVRNLVFTGDNIKIESEEERDVILLPLDTQELIIEDSEFRTSSNSFLDAIPSLIQSKDLRKIEIGCCKGDMEFLMRLSNCRSRMRGDDGVTSTCCPLQYLESLELWMLNEFSGLCKLELGEALPPVGTFSRLRLLEVRDCNKMKKLIPRWLLQYLLNLTEIDVLGCKEMEEIITEDEEEEFKQWGSSASSSRSIKDDEVVLPKLQVLYLLSLPKLKSIYKGRMTCSSIKSITVMYCPELKRLPLTFPLRDGQPSAPPALEEITMWNKEEWESLEWENPQYKNLLHPFFREFRR